MVYIMNESGGDFQQGGCLYKLIINIYNLVFDGHPSIHGRLTDLRKSRPVNFLQWCSGD